MNAHIDDILPFYINQTLSTSETARAEAHLAACPTCRASLDEWKSLAEAANRAAVQPMIQDLMQPALNLPPLSPVVVANLRRNMPLHQAFLSAANLVWAQHIFLGRGFLMPALGSLVLLGSLAAYGLGYLRSQWIVLPLLAVIPIAAALVTAFLFSTEEDPAREIIASVPTPAGTIIFARLTLGLGAIGLLAGLSSMALAAFERGFSAFFDLVAVWLGPALLISAVTTTLSLVLHPKMASGIALLLWGSLLIVLHKELTGSPLPGVSLAWMLKPDWVLVGLQSLLAGVLWGSCWLWLARRGMSFTEVGGG
jgi:hypothetical protein